jgi:hypothetical protein
MKKLLTIFIALLPFFVEAQTTYHVASDGSGNFTTIAQVNAATFSAGDNILFKRGDTFYGEIVVSQSGISGNPITYGAYGTGAKPVITGMQAVISWTNKGGNIWESTNTVSNLNNVKQVIINGVTIPMGATPNRDATYPFLPNYYTYQSHTGTGLGTTTLTSSSLDGTNWTGADVVVRANHWTMDKESITASNSDTITYTGGTAGTDGNGLVDGWGFFIQNDLRTLDRQGEWYYDPSTKKLSIYSTSTPSGVSVTNIDTVFYARTKSYINIDNLDFEGANTSAIVLSSSHHCTVSNTNISYTGEIALSANNTSNYLTVDNCTMSDLGSGGIWNNDGGTNWIITNNTIKRQNLVSVTRANDYTYGAINITSPNALVQYNTIDSAGYEGIHFRGSNPQVRNNLVKNYGFLRDDGGGIYTGFANELGKIVDGNIILNSIGNGRGVLGGATASNGIYADGLTDGASLTNNTIADIRNAGMFLNNDTAMFVRGNTIFNCGRGSDFTRGNLMVQTYNGSPYAGYQRNNFVTNNIFYQKRAEQYNIFFYESTEGTNTAQNFGTLDSNLYIKASDNNVVYYDRYDTASTAMTFSRWKTTSSQEAHGSAYAGNGTIDTNQVILVYNPTKVDSVVNLGAVYKDFKDVTYTNTITLSPYRSALLIYDSPLIAAPTVSMSGTQSIVVDSASVYAIATWASGHSGTYNWTKTSGPGTTTFDTPTNFSTNVRGLQTGTYIFHCTLTQDDSQTTYGEVTVTVAIPPVISAGQSLNLPLPTTLINH